MTKKIPETSKTVETPDSGTSKIKEDIIKQRRENDLYLFKAIIEKIMSLERPR